VASERLANDGAPITPATPLTQQAIDTIAPAQLETPSTLPEAPVSICLKGKLHGQEVLVTLRGTTFTAVKAQVEAASAWLQAQK